MTHIEYDPNRSARIALVHYEDGEKRYILAPDGLKAGMSVSSGPDAEPKVGNCLPLSKIPTGLSIHNIEMQPGGGGKLCRSAGVGAILTARDGNWAQITLPSGEVRRIPAACRATIGMVGNPDHMNVRLGKAGRSRWLGRRPHVRGVAMNPVDHPMGGGEGRTSGGRHPCSPTGKLAKGGKTRRRRKPSNKAIIRRRRSVRLWAAQDLTKLTGVCRVTGHGKFRKQNRSDAGMGRSLKKGPYVVERLLEKVIGPMPRAAASRSRPGRGPAPSCPNSSARISRSTTGGTFIKLYVTEDMVGHRLGEFAPTRTFQGPRRQGIEGAGCRARKK